MTLIYGFDPLCGWCYGAVPMMRDLQRRRPGLPVRLVMAGLVTGGRIGPYAEMAGYIRGASDRLEAVTGRRPSGAFFDLIRRAGVLGDSGPPAVAIDAVRRAAPDAALTFAHAVIEAHFEQGMDLNDRAAYAPFVKEHAPGLALPDIHDPALAEAAFAEGRRLGIASFPSLILLEGDCIRRLPSVYDADSLISATEGPVAVS